MEFRGSLSAFRPPGGASAATPHLKQCLPWVTTLLLVTAAAIFLYARPTSRCSPQPPSPFTGLNVSSAYMPLTAVVSPFPASFWYVKNVKVGGSTLAGVLRGVATRSGVAALNPKPGRIGWKKVDEIRSAAAAAHALGFEHTAITNHGAYLPEAGEFLTTPAVAPRTPLLFTTVRHPVGRVLSAYFFNLIGEHRGRTGVYTREEGERCVADLRAGRSCALLEGFEDHYVHGDGPFGRNHVFKYISGGKESPKAAYEQYDFVFVTERFDESLVIWALKYGVPLRDIAYLRVKDRTGTYPKEEDMPAAAVDLIRSGNAMDAELWDLANAGLDTEVERLRNAGHDVKGALRAFVALQAAVGAECSDVEQWYADRGFDTAVVQWGKDNGVGSRCVEYTARMAGF
jgi:hypothetical protein